MRITNKIYRPMKQITKEQRDKSWPSNTVMTIAAILGFFILVVCITVGAIFAVSVLALFGVGI